MLNEALAYAKRGWRVLPLHTIKSGTCTCGRAKCQSPGKHPRARRGVLDSTVDAKQIKAWWKRWPHANVGIATGKGSGLVVLDVDAEGGEDSLHTLELEHEPLPDTPESHTGGGGRHLLFEHPDDGLVPNKVGIERGLDVRGDGGYIVAPPSSHQSGHAYAWEAIHGPDDVSLAPLPAWLRGRLGATTAKSEDVSHVATPLEGVAKGKRNATAAKLAGKYLALGLAREEVMALLATWNRACDPPLEHDELEKVLTSIAKRELLKRGEEVGEGADRDTILHVLNERLHMPLEDIVRVGGSEPVYSIVSRGRAVQLSAKQIGNQTTFRNAMIAVAEVVPAKIGPKANPGWDHYLQLMLNIARHVEPGPEATDLGLLRTWVQGFLEARRPVPADEASVVPDDPREAEGGVLVSLPALRSFLMADGIKVTPSRLAQLFAAAGFRRDLASFPLKAGDNTRRAMWLVGEDYLKVEDADGEDNEAD